MPIYTLKCSNEKCENYDIKKDTICKYDERFEQKCEKCQKTLHHVPSEFGFSINGCSTKNGW